MQATAVTTPAAPAQAAPAIAGAAPTQITITGPDGNTQTIAIPQTRAELRAIRDARKSLSDQITSAMGRRDEVATELRKATDAVDRQGLERRLTVLDNRIAQLENELAVTGKQLTMAPASLGSGVEFPSRSNGNMEQVLVPIVSVLTIFVFFPLVLVKARNMWRRGSSGSHTVAQLPADATQRLERLEAGVEAIAIEVERISEGQRFVTKLLSENSPAARIPSLAGEKVSANK